MPGIGLAFSRHPAARAFVAGAAFLAGAAATVALAHAPAEEAFAVPRSFGPDTPFDAAPGTAVAALPRPLAPGEARRVRRILEFQARGDIPAAAAATADLSDPLLLGHILADRLLGGGGRGTAEELGEWLARHADLPDAPAVHALLLTRLPPGAAAPPAPPAVPAPAALAAPAPPADADPPAPAFARTPALDRAVREAARAGSPDRALRLIARTKRLDALYGAQLRAEVAQVLFVQGRDKDALRTAAEAHRRARGRVGLAPYVAGLAAWRLGRPDQAQAHFEAAYRAGSSEAASRSGAAFWAARARLHAGDTAGASLWLRRAAERPDEFYGLLARRTLDRGLAPDGAAPGGSGEADMDALHATPEGRRAFALLQVGQPARAEAELRRLWSSAKDRPDLGRAVLHVARAAGLDGLVQDLARVPPDAVRARIPVRPPVARLRPAGGFRVDPALVHAVARVESNFDPDAVSPEGARGLMQLLPTTAGDLVKGEASGGAIIRRLHDPATNLDLGQRYMLWLAGSGAVEGDLIRLLAAYNAGPSNVARWNEASDHGGDPLLYIEAIPFDETRAYVQRVMLHTWLYAAEMRLPAPSLDELAAGAWPRFTAPPRPALTAGRLR